LAILKKEVEFLITSLNVNDVGLSSEEHDELMLGHKIPAIKAHRNRTGKGLKEAKDFIDNVIENNEVYRKAYKNYMYPVVSAFGEVNNYR